MRQLYYLAGLIVTQKDDGTNESCFTKEDWRHIVDLLVQIETEYFLIFSRVSPESATEDWKKKVNVAMPTYLSYFNQGPLNYEEQI